MPPSPAGPLNWSPEVRRRLDDTIAACASHPAPFAAFDCDNTCILNDIGDALWRRLVTRRALAWHSPALLHLLHDLDPDPQDAIALAADPHSPTLDYLQRWLPLYPIARKRLGVALGLARVAQLMVDLHESVVLQHCHDLLREELLHPITHEPLYPDAPLPERGIRICREVKSLIHELHHHHIPCYLVSASSRWPITAVASLLDIPPQRIIAIDLRVAHERITDQIIPPITFRQGKVDAVLKRLNAPPQLAVGDAFTDLELLQSATELAILLDRGDKELLRAIAPSPHIIVQPRHHLSFDPS